MSTNELKEYVNQRVSDISLQMKETVDDTNNRLDNLEISIAEAAQLNQETVVDLWQDVQGFLEESFKPNITSMIEMYTLAIEAQQQAVQEIMKRKVGV